MFLGLDLLEHFQILKIDRVSQEQQRVRLGDGENRLKGTSGQWLKNTQADA